MVVCGVSGTGSCTYPILVMGGCVVLGRFRRRVSLCQRRMMICGQDVHNFCHPEMAFHFRVLIST